MGQLTLRQHGQHLGIIDQPLHQSHRYLVTPLQDEVLEMKQPDALAMPAEKVGQDLAPGGGIVGIQQIGQIQGHQEAFPQARVQPRQTICVVDDVIAHRFDQKIATGLRQLGP
ncbi:hypothetical protein D3C85_1127640 [compost metagenome]